MSPDYKKKFIKWIVIALIGIVFSTLVLVIRDDYAMRGFIDALFIPGAVFISLYLLGVVARLQTFDLFSYTFVRWRDNFRKDQTKNYVDAYDYLEHKKEERSKKTPYSLPLLVVGLTLIFVAIILNILS